MAENYQVKQNDCISSIAFERGFFPDTIWNHPNNKDLKNKREDPNVLMPGDIVYIPDKRLREYSETTNQVYKYKCKNTPKVLRIQIKYLEDPMPNAEYQLKVDGLEKKGKTDGDGWLQQSILPNAKRAYLYVEEQEFQLTLGELDPVDEANGIQQRLRTLGFYDGRIDGTMNPETVEAVKVFQIKNGLTPNGTVDQTVKDLLVKETGE